MKSIEARTKIMYPRVKAEEDVSNWNQKSFCPKSNSLQSRLSEYNQEEDSHIYVAKIPKSYIPSVLMSETESKEMKKRIKRVDIQVKQKPKASSPILRPRAVVSSPDNDVMIGSINKSEEKKAKKCFNSSGDNQIRSRASQRKNIDSNVKISHPPVTKQSGVISRVHK